MGTLKRQKSAKAAPAAAAKPTPPASEAKGKANSAAQGDVIRNLAIITALVILPYAAWVLFHYVHLQSGWMRQPVADNGVRQMLIVGAQGSGTTETTNRLQALGLEVAHESSDATWMFARDGTVSWLHAMRFFPGEASNASLHGICASSRRNMGFHPAMYRVPRRGCSYRQEYDNCWRAECVDIVVREWGCAARAVGDPAGGCETPYARALLQVRHPLRNVESLCVKFCTTLESEPHPHVLAFLRALWPSHPWDSVHGCAYTMGWLWTLYNEAMLSAHQDARRLIHSWYRVETSDACSTAELAGLLAADTSVDAYAHDKALAGCAGGAGPKQEPSEQRANQRNKGQVRLRLVDVVSPPASAFQVDGQVDGHDEASVHTLATLGSLEARIRALASAFGYQDELDEPTE